jgi:hypothetical protein
MMGRHIAGDVFRGLVAGLVILSSVGCGIVAPTCSDETGGVLHATEHVASAGVAAFEVMSPKHSNLVIRVIWPETAATLGLRATIVSCGDHAGCRMDTLTPAPGPGGSSPNLPWPSGLREMLVDGTRGKSYRVEVLGDPVHTTTFILTVSYVIACES